MFLLLSACGNTQTNIINGTTMGTTYNIQQVDGRRLSLAQIEAKLSKINAIFSTWDDNSQLSLLNKMPINQWIDISAELFFVLQHSKILHQQTRGYFDIGIGRLIDLWGFGVNKIKQKPNRVQINKALKNSSIVYLELSAGKVRKTQDIHLDLSAIAKGYAVDQIAQLLLDNNSQNFLVEIGGEIVVRGKNGNKNWILGIKHPDNAQPITVKLTNQAIATSGDYRNYFIWENQQYPHILNPHNGLPTTSDLTSVSVLHAQAMIADAFATAMMVMGSKSAIALANQLNLRVIMILDKAQQHKILRVNL